MLSVTMKSIQLLLVMSNIIGDDEIDKIILGNVKYVISDDEINTVILGNVKCYW